LNASAAFCLCPAAAEFSLAAALYPYQHSPKIKTDSCLIQASILSRVLVEKKVCFSNQDFISSDPLWALQRLQQGSKLWRLEEPDLKRGTM
jgi:hypothetical protein